ncbi:MAG: DNA/RNA nuclease SfsA [Deltaproteobacteria bacterium]|nr:DNA/RNA nuclease SfsA [Deltaproteobacteria bacterium]MBW1984792.1 DNA/RNA nuclease SfsA [Deltaproteobacteria bacterium]
MKNANNEKRYKGLAWPTLIEGVLVKRYKRFLADVKLADGSVVTAHCPNSGSMKECAEPGRKVYISYHDNPKRKLKYTWEMIDMPTSLTGVNTFVPNRLVSQSIREGSVDELSGYDTVKPEVSVEAGSRLDLLLARGENEKCFVEIKNCTLVTHGEAYFPDAVTARGLKHLRVLEKLVSKNYRCVMFYLIQRMDANVFKPADHIDPAYGQALREAVKNGVEILVYDVRIDLEKIVLGNRIPHVL